MPSDAWAPGYKSSAQHINTGLAPTLQPQDQTARCLLHAGRSSGVCAAGDSPAAAQVGRRIAVGAGRPRREPAADSTACEPHL